MLLQIVTCFCKVSPQVELLSMDIKYLPLRILKITTRLKIVEKLRISSELSQAEVSHLIIT